MKIGFTGTRDGMTNEQKDSFKGLIKTFKPNEFLHGDCKGADEDAHNIIYENLNKCIINIHPPIKDKLRAFCKGHITHEKKEYIQRNHDIVDHSNFMIACVKGKKEEIRSGTWATIRWTIKMNKSIYIIWPDGLIN